MNEKGFDFYLVSRQSLIIVIQSYQIIHYQEKTELLNSVVIVKNTFYDDLVSFYVIK